MIKHFENILNTSAQAKVFKEIETPLESVLLTMEADGIEVDITWLKTLPFLSIVVIDPFIIS